MHSKQRGSDRLPYVNKQQRRMEAINKALELSKTRSYQTLTIKGLARALNCKPMCIYRAVGNRMELHTAIEQHAIALGSTDPQAKPVLLQMAAIGRLNKE